MTQLSSKRKPRRLPRLVTVREVLPEIYEADIEVFDRRCHQIFERLRPSLIESYYNWSLIVEPDSGDYFLDEDEFVAYHKARSKYPQRQFFFFRVNETGACGKI